MAHFFRNILFGLLYLSPIHNIWAGDVQIFPVPNDAKPAPDYKMNVEGKDVFIYNSTNNPFAIFNFSGSVQVAITSDNDIKWVNIRPLNDSIQWSARGNVLNLILDHPCNLSIEINDDPSRALFIFAGPFTSTEPDRNNIIRFAGGKFYDAGNIELKSNDIVLIEGGAIVRGTIHADHADNIMILGNGELDGTIPENGKPKRMIDLQNCHHVIIKDLLIHNSPTWTLVADNCSDIDIDNLKEINWKFGTDGIDLVSTSHVKIHNSFLKNNDDCIAIKSFNNSADNNADDTLAKSPNVTDISVDSCTFWNMPWGNALEIGFELQCDSIYNINFRNINIIHVERGAAMSIHNGDFARVFNIHYENITVENSDYKLIDLAIFLSQYSLDRPSSGEERKKRYLNGAWDGVLKINPGEENQHETYRGYIDQIYFDHIRVIDGPYPFSIISGYNSRHNIDHVTINDLTILGKKILSPLAGHFYIGNADNIVFQ